jgi:hypothetical protein
MKKIVIIILIIVITSFLCIFIHVQENDNPSLKLRGNSLNIYFGLCDMYNINY